MVEELSEGLERPTQTYRALVRDRVRYSKKVVSARKKARKLAKASRRNNRRKS